MVVYSTSFEVEDEAEAKRLHLVLNQALCSDTVQRVRNYKAKIEKKESELQVGS
jgi:hypothetical protein